MPTYTDANGNKVATTGWETALSSLSWWLRYFKAPISGVVDLMTPDFGLFGGPGFCGGHLFNSDNECIDGSGISIEEALSIAPAKNSLGDISLSDAAFKAHDEAYYYAWKANQEDSTINESFLQLQADAVLLQALYNVFTDSNYTMDKVEIAYDLLAAKAFAAKIMAFDLAATGVEGFTDTAVQALKETAQFLSDSITTKSETYTIDHLTHPADPSELTTLTGDLVPVDVDPNTAGIQTHTDQWGNIITDPSQPSPGRADVLFDTSGNDRIEVGDGDDILIGDNGDLLAESLSGGDYIDGGAGHDEIDGNAGNDELFGGADNDTIYGDAGDDYLDGGHHIQIGCIEYFYKKYSSKSLERGIDRRIFIS